MGSKVAGDFQVKYANKKARHCRAFSLSEAQLFDFGFFVDHMLAHDGIELLDLHFIRHSALVLVGGVEVAGTGAGYESDFVTHVLFS